MIRLLSITYKSRSRHTFTFGEKNRAQQIDLQRNEREYTINSVIEREEMIQRVNEKRDADGKRWPMRCNVIVIKW